MVIVSVPVFHLYGKCSAKHFGRIPLLSWQRKTVIQRDFKVLHTPFDTKDSFKSS